MISNEERRVVAAKLHDNDEHGKSPRIKWEQHVGGYIKNTSYNSSGKLTELRISTDESFGITLSANYGDGVPSDGISELAGKRLNVSLSFSERGAGE